jgi:hypothetical protein
LRVCSIAFCTTDYKLGNRPAERLASRVVRREVNTGPHTRGCAFVPFAIEEIRLKVMDRS